MYLTMSLHNLFFALLLFSLGTCCLSSAIISPRSEAQWVEIQIRNLSTKVLEIKDVNLIFGKFHADGDKGNEISTNDVEGKTIGPGSTFTVSSSGRANSATGTEGSFEIWSGNELVRKVYWDCPWGLRSNTFTVDGGSDKWVAMASPANPQGGPIGHVDIRIAEDI